MIGIEDAYDIHVHAGPELFPRLLDGRQIAERARELGVAGIVFKAHHESTVTRAYHVAQMVEDIELYGGLALNQFVGGINPVAVSAALNQGAKIIWMPTLHSRNHYKELGRGTYGIPYMQLSNDAIPVDGLSILDSQGRLTAEALMIVQQVRDANALLATGHLDGDEVLALTRAARDAGTRCVVTHAFFPSGSRDVLREAVSNGAIVEVSASVTFPMAQFMGHSMSLSQVRDVIGDLGVDNVVVSSDAGQIHNAPAPDVLRSFVNMLVAVGIDSGAVRRMIVDMPRRLLGLD